MPRSRLLGISFYSPPENNSSAPLATTLISRPKLRASFFEMIFQSKIGRRDPAAAKLQSAILLLSNVALRGRDQDAWISSRPTRVCLKGKTIQVVMTNTPNVITGIVIQAFDFGSGTAFEMA